MKPKLLALLFAASLWGYGDGIVYWAPHGCDEGKTAASRHGGHGRGETAMFAAMNLEGNASAKLILPDLSVQPLTFRLNTVMLPKPPMGGYYAMVTESNGSNSVSSAVRYLSLQGRPAKISPTKLTALPKADLEIVPDPLHREHDRYTASKSYRFVLKYKNTPLAATPVVLETHNHTTQHYTSDAKGIVTVTLPNDFSGVRVGRSENRPGEFLLSTQHRDGETLYTSTFSMPYYVNPNDYWQSQRSGAGAILAGFLGGLLLYRRHKKQGVSRG